MVNEVLLTGKENALSAKEISAILHVDIRAVTRAIERERREGKPICANTDSATRSGYFLAKDADEMKWYISRLSQREKEIARTRRACAKTEKAMRKEEQYAG